ncbi:type 2 periplasmic-binding domain-containing protein [Streptomyces aureocirculatus]|uniref:hypothetical protein n=1 Tax=Streptomyces aureocirculatus TaxID=67275 RepID=UPI00068CA2E9|nr:hypothetical protein [Streptomyces aureocirculatus]
MTTPHLDIAVTGYDNTRALFDGTVTFDGLNVTLHSPAIPEIFAGMAAGEFDLAEFGLTRYLRALDAGTDLLAFPVFPARVFRHSSVFVNTTKGITGPADLVGRTIGEFGSYGQDSGVWAKGILAEDYGFAPENNRWVIGGLETPLTAGFEFTTHPHPQGVDVGFAPPGRTLAEMLVDAEQNRQAAQKKLDIPVLALGGSAFIGDRNESQMELFAHDVTGHVFNAGHDLAEEVPDEMAEVVLPFLAKQR